MIKRFTLLFLAFFSIVPVFAGQLEDAMRTNTKIFLYLYTPSCTACKAFNSHYIHYMNKYSNKCRFLKINASTQYGAKLAYNYNLRYVPWVILIDSKKKQNEQVEWSCLRQPACAQKTIEKFINN